MALICSKVALEAVRGRVEVGGDLLLLLLFVVVGGRRRVERRVACAAAGNITELLSVWRKKRKGRRARECSDGPREAF